LAHEIRNPLNGIALNLEVVRSRAARGGTDAASVAPFAESATAELLRATPLVEALLTLARPVRKPVDLWDVLQPLTVVFHAIASANGGAVTVERPVGEEFTTAADGSATRLALATALQQVLVGAAAVRCLVERSPDAVVVSMFGPEPCTAVPEMVQAALVEEGIELGRSP
jgi:signal transduction histidine kinase